MEPEDDLPEPEPPPKPARPPPTGLGVPAWKPLAAIAALLVLVAIGFAAPSFLPKPPPGVAPKRQGEIRVAVLPLAAPEEATLAPVGKMAADALAVDLGATPALALAEPPAGFVAPPLPPADGALAPEVLAPLREAKIEALALGACAREAETLRCTVAFFSADDGTRLHAIAATAAPDRRADLPDLLAAQAGEVASSLAAKLR